MLPPHICLLQSHAFYFCRSTFSDYNNNLPESGWFHSQCMVNVDGTLYHWNNDDMDQVELKPWVYTNLGELPEEMLRPGRCASVEIDGQPGIMTR